MAQKTLDKGPNYHRIFQDIIARIECSNVIECQKILHKEVLTSNDVIKINNLIFKKKNKEKKSNFRLRSYDKASIRMMLDYQKKNHLTNVQTAEYFAVSRNSISKWRKWFSA